MPGFNRHLRLILAAAALVAVALVAGPGSVSAGGGGCHGAPENEGSGMVVTIAGCFSPTVLRVEPGARVSFQNTDPYLHVVIGQTWTVIGDLAGGSSGEVLFPKAGTFPYACTLHPGMVGVVIVGDGKVSAAGQVSASAPSYERRSAPPSTPNEALAAAAATEANESAIMAGPAWLAAGVAAGAGLGALGVLAVNRVGMRRRVA
jgi:plastocyanin